MKALKYILIGIVCLVVIICLLGLILPKDYTVARSTVINAPRPVVMDNIKSLKTMDEWSPWSKRDPNMKKEFAGTDGEVGSSLAWDGNDDVGKGKQEVAAVNDNTVDLKLTFLEPDSQADVNFTVADSADASKVTWSMHGKMPFPFNVMGLFMNMDEMIGKDFEEGLAGLKTMSEQEAAHKTYGGYEIKEVNFEPKVYIAKRSTVKFQEIPMYFEKNVPFLMEETGKAGVQPAGGPVGLYFKWDDANMQTDMAVAVPVAPGTKVPQIKGTEQVQAEGKALYIAYYGNPENMKSAYDGIHTYMTEKNLAMNNLVVEEYMFDPKTEPDQSKWLTNIYYLVK